MKNSSIEITATLAEAILVKNIVERLAGHRPDIGYNLEQMPTGSKAMEQSSIEVYVSGDIIYEDKEEYIIMPFDTSFLFTCTKSRTSEYSLTWASSLS